MPFEQKPEIRETTPPAAAQGAAGDNVMRGIACMLASILGLSLMDAIAKWVVANNAIPTIIAIRSAFILLLMVPIVMRAGGPKRLATRRIGLHALRSALTVGAIFTFMEPLRHLPLATVVSIGFAAPLFMTALSMPLLGERVGPHRWAAVGVGFLGVLVITRPGAEEAYSLPALMMLVSSLLFALQLILLRYMAKTETSEALMVYQNGGTMLAGLAAMPFVWVAPTQTDIAMIALLAVMLTAGQLFMIQAFRFAPVAVVAPFQYTELIWAALLGLAIWDELPGVNVWIGAAIVVASGIYITWREARSAERR